MQDYKTSYDVDSLCCTSCMCTNGNECIKCKLLVQKDSMEDHQRMCEMRELQCGAQLCELTGLKSDLFEQVVHFHERDILNITQIQRIALIAQYKHTYTQQMHLHRHLPYIRRCLHNQSSASKNPGCYNHKTWVQYSCKFEVFTHNAGCFPINPNQRTTQDAPSRSKRLINIMLIDKM